MTLISPKARKLRDITMPSASIMSTLDDLDNRLVTKDLTNADLAACIRALKQIISLFGGTVARDINMIMKLSLSQNDIT